MVREVRQRSRSFGSRGAHKRESSFYQHVGTGVLLCYCWSLHHRCRPLECKGDTFRWLWPSSMAENGCHRHRRFGGHVGCFMKQNGPEMSPKSKATTAKVRTENQNRMLQVIEILSIIQPRRAPSSLCARWGPWWLFHKNLVVVISRVLTSFDAVLCCCSMGMTDNRTQ
jgi:hypothetical protein